jgi:hypothetical protein
MHQKVIVLIVLVIVLIAALVIGVDIGRADYENMSLYIGVALTFYFFLHGWKTVWWIIALLVFTNPSFVHQFDFDSRHVFTLAIIVTSCVAYIHGRRDFPRLASFRQAGSRPTTFLFGLLLSYGIFHYLVYYLFPYSPIDYSWKSSTKANFQAFAPIFCFLWMMSGFYHFNLKNNWSKNLILIIVFSLVTNLAVMVIQISQGFGSGNPQDTDPNAYALAIPIINLIPNQFALRALCPLAMALILMIVTTPRWWRQASFTMRIVSLFSFPLIITGALYSGGRATPLFCLVIATAVAFARRKVHLIALMGCSITLVFGGVNVFSHQINTQAPMLVARSAQFLMITKDDRIYGSVTNSQESREGALKAALILWKQDNRILFFGRSVFSFTKKDAAVKGNGDIDGFIENCLRTGGVHNLVGDLLLQYGLIGCSLYLSAYVAVLRFFWRLSSTIPTTNPLAKSLAGAMKIYLPLMFIYQLLGGTFLPMEAALVVGLIRASLLRVEDTISITSPTATRTPTISNAFAS